MNTEPLATGITLLSGAGGSGRTSAALGLAGKMAQKGYRTLFFDLCFGWGGLNIGNSAARTYEQLFEPENTDNVCEATEYGFDLVTCEPSTILFPDERELSRITYLIHQLGGRYDIIILDPPASAHPLSLLAAGICEAVYLVVKPDASAVASSYNLLKSLAVEGLSERIKIIFGMVDSPENALSLKSRFDKLTDQFLQFSFPDGGFIYRQDNTGNSGFKADEGIERFITNVKNITLNTLPLLQNETNVKNRVNQSAV